MVEERRVRELEIRMDELVARIDGVEAAVAEPRSRDAEERPARFEAPTATWPSFPHPGPGPQASAREAPAREAPAPRAASRMPRLLGLQHRPRMKDVLGDRSVEDLLGSRILAWWAAWPS